jgi:hypothetical protein
MLDEMPFFDVWESESVVEPPGGEPGDIPARRKRHRGTRGQQLRRVCPGIVPNCGSKAGRERGVSTEGRKNFALGREIFVYREQPLRIKGRSGRRVSIGFRE